MTDNSFNYIGLHTYGRTIDNHKAAVEVYWDLSGANCLFSRDYTRYNNTDTESIGLSSAERKINQFIYPYGARPILDCSTVATPEGWKDGVIYNKTDCSNIFIIAKVKTPIEFNSINNLFLLGATTSDGGYIGGLKDGVPFFGIQGDLNSTKKIGAFSDCSDVCHQVEGITDISGDISNNPQKFKLSRGKKYELEYYYNYDSSKCLINVKSLESQDIDISGVGDYLFKDISNSDPSGIFGFEMTEGNLSIGTTSHIANSNLWGGEIYKMSIYANDISNIPLFDLSRNGFILDDCSQNKYSSFYDNSRNKGLIIEPSNNEYQVKFTDQSYTGQSYIKETILHDIYYLQRITDQNILPLSNTTDLNTTYTKQVVTVMDKFSEKSSYNNEYYEMWAGGYDKTNNIIKPRLWNSINGGETWNIIENWPPESSQGDQILDLKTYIDPDKGRWVFVCGENYMLHTTNDYGSDGSVGGEILGSTWKIIYDNSGGEFEELLEGGTTKRLAISTINVVDIDETQSDLIFPNNPASSKSFHLWLGTFGGYDLKNESIYGKFQPGININITVPSGYPWPQEIWWTLEDAAGTIKIATRPSNGATGAPYNSGSNSQPDNNPSFLIGCPYNQNHFLPNGSYTLKLYDSYGDGWHGTPMTVTNIDTNSNLFPSGDPTNTYTSFPDVAPDEFPLFIGSGSSSSAYPYDNPGYRDILIRGNYDDFKGDTLDYSTLDYSYNIITNQILDASSNPDATFDIETFNSFSFGGNYTDNTAGLNYGILTTNNYIFLTKNGGLTWDKKLEDNRINLFGTSNNVRGTWGSYVEKNKKNGSYDNSGMYVQTSTEPWNGLPGLTLAYNNSDYNLSFNLNPLKTWDPSLNANAFWNVNIPDNSGVQVLYRGGGGNTIKTYISDEDSTSTSSIYEKKQQMWTFDSCIPGSKIIPPNDYQQSSLYLRDSEFERDSWQRITPSIVDKDLNSSYSSNNSLRWDGFTPYDCSYSIVNLPFSDINGKISNNIDDHSQYLGFYKLSKLPFTPFIVIEQSPSDIYSVELIIKYLKGDGEVLNPADYNTRLDFDKLGIEPIFQVEVKSDISIPWSDQWKNIIEEFPDQANSFGGTYLETIRNLIPGNVYRFRVALQNDYGLSWYSNDSDAIDALALTPSISNFNISSKLFNNVLTWDVNTETVNNENLQTVYNYDILKSYYDKDNYIFQEMGAFNNFHKDLSGVLSFSKGSLVGRQFTGPYNPVDSSNNLNPISKITLIDNDISLNFFYKYEVIPYDRKGNPGETLYKTVNTPDGKAIGLNSRYTVKDASFNFIWSLASDIADNTKLTWDISWQEIRKDGSTDISSEIIDYLDPYSRDGVNKSVNGKNESRLIGIDLLQNNHLQADASYNFQIKGQYDISINEAGWVFDISSQSITADIGTTIIQPKPWSLNLTTPLRITEDKGVSGEQVNDFSSVLINSLQNVNLLELELTTTGFGAEPSGITILQDGYKIWGVSVNALDFSSLSGVDISQGGYTKGQLFSPLQNYWEIDLSGAAQSFDFSLGADIYDPSLNVIIRQGENLVTLDISMDNVDDFSGVNIGDLLTHSDGFRSSIGKVAKIPKTVWLLGVDNEPQSHSAGTIVWQQDTSTYPPNIANSTARGILRYGFILNPGSTNPVIIESDISENFTISDPSGNKPLHFQNTTDDLLVNSVSKFITIDASLNNWYDFSNNPVDLSLNNIFINSTDISSATTQIVGYDASGILNPNKSLFTEVPDSSGVYNFTKLAVNTETLDITFTDTKDLLIPPNTLNRDISSIYIGDISKNNQLKLEIITDLSNVNIIINTSNIQIGDNIIEASDILQVDISDNSGADVSGTLRFPLTGVDISNIYINCASDIEFYIVRDLNVKGVGSQYTISHNKINALDNTYGKTTDISLSSYSNVYGIDPTIDFTLGSYTIPGGQYSVTSSDGYSEGALKTQLIGTGMIGFFVPGNDTEGWHKKRDLEISGNIKIPFDTILSDPSHINQNYATSSSSMQIPSYSNGGNDYDASGVFVYYNYQQPPKLIDVSYNPLTNEIDMNWSEPTAPEKPDYYDISFSHSSISDISYNYRVSNGTTLTDPSNNGKNYYPGFYNVNLRAAYGDQVPVDDSLFSGWSNDITLNTVPDHSPNILTSELYYNNDVTTFTTDVSRVKLSWDNVDVDSGFKIDKYPIPKNYTLERQTANKYNNYVLDLNKDISGTDTSYNDYVMYGISGDKTAPRIYRYSLKPNYETSNVS